MTSSPDSAEVLLSKAGSYRVIIPTVLTVRLPKEICVQNFRNGVCFVVPVEMKQINLTKINNFIIFSFIFVM